MTHRQSVAITWLLICLGVATLIIGPVLALSAPPVVSEEPAQAAAHAEEELPPFPDPCGLASVECEGEPLD